jgi:tetratricopeptide (TPR) repeat protein
MKVQPEAHLWAGTFERDAEDVLALLRDLAADIASNITVAIDTATTSAGETRKVDPDAYAAFLAGVHYNAQMSPKGLEQAVALFHTAIAKDPDFAAPVAHLAVAMFNLLATAVLDPREHIDRLTHLAASAVRLDPLLPEAWAAHAWSGLLKCDLPAAVDSLQRGISAAPSHSYPHLMAVLAFTAQRAFDRAIAAAHRVLELDPWAPWASAMMGWALHYAGRDAEAIPHLHRVLELHPDCMIARFILPKSLLRSGDEAGAIAAAQQSLAAYPDNAIVLGYAAFVLSHTGHHIEAHQLLERLYSLRAATGWVCPYYVAIALGALGRRDEAFAELERMVAGESVNGYLLAIDPFLEPLRDDARFDRIVEAIGVGSKERGSLS